MSKVNLILSAFLMMLLVGCGSSQNANTSSDVEEEISNIPEFFTNPPNDTEEFLYGTGTAVSSRQMMALQKAENTARQSIAQKLGEKVDALQKSFTEEITSGNNSNFAESFSNVNKILTSQELKGVTTEERQFISVNQNQQLRSYVLMKMPVGQARAALENALSQEEELYVKFKESKAFKELEEELHKVGNDE